jgi:hypothetical protein
MMLVSVIKCDEMMICCFQASSAWQIRRFRVCADRTNQFCLANPEVPDLEPGGSGFVMTELTSSAWQIRRFRIWNLEVPGLC